MDHEKQHEEGEDGRAEGTACLLTAATTRGATELDPLQDHDRDLALGPLLLRSEVFDQPGDLRALIR